MKLNFIGSGLSLAEVRTSKIMHQWEMSNGKIEVIWNSAVVEAYVEKGMVKRLTMLLAARIRI